MDFTAYHPQSRDDFHIAVFCALPHEANKVIALFDVDWRKQGVAFGRAPTDSNIYTLGTIGRHNVVVVHLGRTGINEANTAAATISLSFTNISLAFVVGICGIVPQHDKKEVMLGDCIVGTSVVQLDFGHQYPQAFIKTSKLEDVLARPGRVVTNVLALLRAEAELSNKLDRNLQILQKKMTNININYPSQDDSLFHPEYIHTHRTGLECPECIPGAGICKRSCQELHCNEERILRTRAGAYPPDIHFGRIGSTDTVMSSSQHRDVLARQHGLLAFETESCGVWDHYPTIVIKSGSNYADSHKSSEWQEYASAVAACGFKTVLEMLDIENPQPREGAPPAWLVTSTAYESGSSNTSTVMHQRLLTAVDDIRTNPEPFTIDKSADDEILDRLNREEG